MTVAGPRDELLRFVPADVGFCLVVQDLRTHWASFAESDFARHFRESALGQALRKDAEFQKLVDLEKVLKQFLGVEVGKLRDEILGDAVVFAYRPGPAGKPEQEQGLILVRARDARLLADLVERLDRLQQGAGEVKVQVREHNGRKYHHRAEAKGENSYYYLNGPVLMLSQQEAMLRQALDLERTAPADEAPAVVRQLRQLGADRALASLWINPQAFTAEIEWKITQAKEAEAAVLRHFLTCWKSLEGIALTAGVTRDFEFTLAVRARTEMLPPAVRKLLAEAARPSALWNRFPEDALLATACRLDLSALLEVLDGFLTRETRQVLHDSLERNIGAVVGKNVVKEVLPALGPDWGLCLTAPPAGDRLWAPQAVLALRVRPGDKGAPVDQALLATLHSYAMLAVVGYNRQHKDQMILKTARFDALEVRYLANDQAFPPGMQPAFALHDGYLMMGSSPAALRRLAAAIPAREDRAGETPLMRMALKELRCYLQERREPLIALGAERNQVPKEEVQRGMDGLLAVLQLFDRLELSQRQSQGQVTLTLRVQPARPVCAGP
jgi:hypothetical protein